MNTLYKIILTIVVSLSFHSAFAVTLTGESCKRLLMPVTHIFTNQYTHTVVNSGDSNRQIEGITNAAGTSLEDISNLSSRHRTIQNYIDNVKVALEHCKTRCEGLPLKSTRTPTLSCETLKTTTPAQVHHGLENVLEDDATVELVAEAEETTTEQSSAKCAVEPHLAECQREEVQEVAAATAPEPTTISVEVERPHYQDPAANSNRNPTRRGLRTNGFEHHINNRINEPVEVEI